MKSVLGVIAILLAGFVGVVEFRAIIDPAVAHSISDAFAAHDPFPRLPWDYHVIFVLLFLGLLASGLHFVFQRKGHGTNRI
jgi:hypothetical protein